MEWWQHRSVTLAFHCLITPILHHSVPAVTLACHAMATRFEVVLHGDNPAALRAAGEEALRLVEQLEGQLSLFRAEQRNRAPERPRGARAGAGHAGTVRTAAAGAEAACGERRRVRYHDRPTGPVLGIYGRNGTDAQCGGSGGSAREGGDGAGAIGARRISRSGLPGRGSCWTWARSARATRSSARLKHCVRQGSPAHCCMAAPAQSRRSDSRRERSSGRSRSKRPRLHQTRRQPSWPPCRLKTRPCPFRACWGNSFQVGARTFGHIIDPRTGDRHWARCWLRWCLPSATETDALSTALLTLGKAGHERIAKLRPGRGRWW